jgi:hypothetical protein
MKRTLFLGLVLTILFAACKKDPVETQLTLKGMWSLDSIISKEYFNGALLYDYGQSGDGAKLDFQANGNLVVSNASGTPGNTQTVQYSISGSNVTIDGDSHEIRSLTASTVTLYRRDNYSANEYEDIYLKLKR